MIQKKILLFILGCFLMAITAGNLYAGSISGASIWLNRVQDESFNTSYFFFTDIWGTVSEFQSITVTSPLDNTYPLSLSPEGDQWGNGLEGTEEILTEFVDGIYTFDVTYTDTTTDSVDVQLGGVFPAFPTSLSLNGNTISWDSWVNPVYPYQIEIEVHELVGGEIVAEGDHFGTNLSYTETSFTLPTGFLKINTQYEIEVWFVTNQFEGGYKASVRSMTIIIQNPEIVSIVPMTGVINDGTLVAITGLNFGDSQGSGKVTFGGLDATIVSWSDKEIILTTPAHAAGVVDVAVTTNESKTITSSNAFIYHPQASTFSDNFDDPVFTNSHWLATPDSIVPQTWSFATLNESDLGYHFTVDSYDTNDPVARIANKGREYYNAGLHIETLVRIDSHAAAQSIDNKAMVGFSATVENAYMAGIQLDYEGVLSKVLYLHTHDMGGLPGLDINVSVQIDFDTFYKLTVLVDSDQTIKVFLYDLEGTLLGSISSPKFLPWNKGAIAIAGKYSTTFNNFSLSGVAAIKPGDINYDGDINVSDTILALQVMSDIATPVPVFKIADINGNGMIGLAEAIYALQSSAELRIGFTYTELFGKTFQLTDFEYPTCIFDVPFNNNNQLVSPDGELIDYTIVNGCIVMTDSFGISREICVVSRNNAIITADFKITGGSFEDRTDRWGIDFSIMNNDATALKDWFVTNGWWPGSAILADGRVTNQDATIDGKWWIDGNVLYLDYPEAGGCVDHKAYKLVNDRLLFATDADATSTYIMVEK